MMCQTLDITPQILIFQLAQNYRNKLSLHEFHSQIFDLAKESITKTPRQDREIQGLTIGLSKDELDSLRKDVSELFLKRFAERFCQLRVIRIHRS